MCSVVFFFLQNSVSGWVGDTFVSLYSGRNILITGPYASPVKGAPRIIERIVIYGDERFLH